ncbi:MAG: HAD-IA family hydrolase [Proteobacteria bacterium]|nr:HAD-IA family hydrolase [Pseudomonadota bacterium]
MGKQKLSAVVFDCDGVLIESNAVKTMAFGQTVAKFGQKAMDQLMDYHRKHGGISRFKKFEWFYREVVKAPLSDEMMDALSGRFSALCYQAVLDAPMVVGARQSLDLLYDRLPMFVASGTPEKELRELLTKKGLAQYFNSISGTPPEKQSLLECIITENNLNAAEVLMVGDATTDMEAALHCNTLFYGRGEQFAKDNVPWSENLIGLIDYLACTFNIF